MLQGAPADEFHITKLGPVTQSLARQACGTQVPAWATRSSLPIQRLSRVPPAPDRTRFSPAGCVMQDISLHPRID